MLSSHNKQLMNQKGAKQRQHFGLRKLTVGVASVLLGTTFFMGTASANTNPNETSSTTPSMDVSSTVTQNEQTNDVVHGTALEIAPQSKQQPTGQTSENQQGGNATQLPTSQLVKDASTEENKTPQSETPVVNNLTFTGSVSDFKNTTSKKSATDTKFKAGDTAELTYTMRSAGNTSALQNSYWPVESHYLAMLPSGFKLTTWQTNFNSADYKITPLGQVGPNGEYVYLIILDKTPYYGVPISFTAHLVATNDAETAGGHDYKDFPIPGLLMAENDNQLFDGHHSITLGGKSYDVANCSAFLHGNGGSEVNYTIVPGTQALTDQNFQIISVKTKKSSSPDGSTAAGYEEVDSTIKLTGSVQAGDYIDFHLGIPYVDSKSGKTEYKPYDSNLAANFNLSKIGKVYNMGTFYRLVFNDQVNQLSDPQFDLQLKWGADNPKASLDNDRVNYVYQATTDPSKDHTNFTYQPTNDITINDQTRASGFSIRGTYIYTKQPIGVGNQKFAGGLNSLPNRTWNQKGDVSVNTNWSNTESVNLSTAEMGNEFDLKAMVEKDPTGLVRYTIPSADDMKTAIEKDVASNDTQTLENGVVQDQQTYVDLDTKTGTQPKVNVTVTRTDSTDPKDPNKLTVTWHVKLTNADPATNPKIVLKGSVPVVTASASNFTMPKGITTYDQDKAQEINTGNYSGAKTNNAALMNVLSKLPVALVSYVPYQNGQAGTQTGPIGGPWTAEVCYAGDRKLDGGGSATDLVTDTISIKDKDTNQNLAPDLSYQGQTGSQIIFSGLQNAYNNVITGYQLDKIVSVNGTTEMPLTNYDLNKLDSYSFGTAGKNNPSQFIIYLKKVPVKATAMITYIDDTTGETLKTDTVNGNVGDKINYQVINYPNYDVVSDGFSNTATYEKPTNQFTIHLKHHIADYSTTKTVRRTINYVKDDGTQIRNPQTQTITFTGTGHKDAVIHQLVDLNTDGSLKKNADGTIAQGTLTWTPDKATMAEVDSPQIEGYDIISVASQTPDQRDGNNVKATTVKADAQNINVIVTYAKDQVATLHFVDDDDNERAIADDLRAHGTAGTAINFTDVEKVVNGLVQKGYVLGKTTDDTAVTQVLSLLAVQETPANAGQASDWTSRFGKFGKTGGKVFTIHFTHRHDQLQDVHQQIVTETIHYVHNDRVQTPAAPDYHHSLTFIGTGYHDAVTNQDVITAWHLDGATTDSGSFATVKNPVLDGYHVLSASDKAGNDVLDGENDAVKAQTGVTHQSADLIMTVVYAANPKPVTPSTPGHKQNSQGTTRKPVSDRAQISAGVKTVTVTPTAPESVGTNHQFSFGSRTNRQLPQTGHKDDQALIGLGMASLVSMLGLLSPRRKNN